MAQQHQNMFDISNDQAFSLPEPYYQEESDYSYRPDENSKSREPQEEVLEQKQEIKTTDISYFVTIEPSKREDPPPEQPKILQFQYEQALRQEVFRAKKGSKDDTVLLNINFKTIIVSIFREKAFLNELSTEDARQLEEFTQRPPSFRSLSIFCRPASKDSVIPKQLLSLIQSSSILKKIMESRCQLYTKLQMIKFLEVLRWNILGQGNIVKWKQLAKKC